MDPKHADIIIAAYEWWLGQRPEGWDESQHITNPWVNCANAYERHLARAVAEYSARRRMTDRQPPRSRKPGDRD
jgi:hypothetical protein